MRGKEGWGGGDWQKDMYNVIYHSMIWFEHIFTAHKAIWIGHKFKNLDCPLPITAMTIDPFDDRQTDIILMWIL